MTDKLYEFRIPVSWAVCGNMYIKAHTLDDAINMASRTGLPDGEYMDGSFEVDTDMAENYNEEILEQIKKDKQPLNNIVENAFPKKSNHAFNITGE